MEDISIEFEIDNPKMISINEQYMHPVRKTKRGSYVSYFAPTPGLKELQNFYKERLQDLIPDDFIDRVKLIISDKSHGINFKMELGLPEEDIREYDISNFIKAVEDCIVQRTGIDDSRHYTVTAIKSLYNSESKAWKLKINYSVEKLKLYQYLPKYPLKTDN